MLLAASCSVSFADGPGNPCLPSDPTCPKGGGAVHLPMTGLQPALVVMR
jgi:hypothetical protein